MKSIETHYIRASQTKPSRMVATDGDNRIIVSYDGDRTMDCNHALAARQLRSKLGWIGTMAGGHTKKGMAWVFVGHYEI
jgi:hypothetical protein